MFLQREAGDKTTDLLSAQRMKVTMVEDVPLIT